MTAPAAEEEFESQRDQVPCLGHTAGRWQTHDFRAVCPDPQRWSLALLPVSCSGAAGVGCEWEGVLEEEPSYSCRFWDQEPRHADQGFMQGSGLVSSPFGGPHWKALGILKHPAPWPPDPWCQQMCSCRGRGVSRSFLHTVL